jgi:hypothetical protein
MVAAKQPKAEEKPAPVVAEILKNAASQWPATFRHTAFHGRVVFETRYDRLGDLPAMRRIYNGLLALRSDDKTPVVPTWMHDTCSNLMAYMVLTTCITFRRPEDHPELLVLHDFWKWYLSHATDPAPDFLELWHIIERMGNASIDQWQKAYNGAQASSLQADRALLPDDMLTDEERNDPFSAPGA